MQKKKDDAVMHYTRVNVKSQILHHSSSLSIDNKTGKSALLHILVEETAKTKKSPEVQYCIVEQFLDVPLKFGIHQYFKQLFPHSGTRKL